MSCSSSVDGKDGGVTESLNSLANQALPMLDSTFALDTQPGIEYEASGGHLDLTNAWAVLYSQMDGLSHFVCTQWSGETFVFGRSEACDVCLVDPFRTSQQKFFCTISGFHFKMTFGPGKVAYILDISTNGTYVNKQRIHKGIARTLAHGDNIGVASGTCVMYNFVYTGRDICPLAVNGNATNFGADLSAKYIVSCVIGTGSYGEVRMAYEREGRGKFAIKCLRKKKNMKANGQAAARMHAKLRLEADILQSVRHPCITSIHETVETDNNLYIVMEHVAGGELFDYILSNGCLAEHEAKLVMYQIAAAVKYLHDKNIVHRDVKPENVLMSTRHDPQCLIKLTDFGLSRLMHSLNTRMKTYCGTPSYLAPEIYGQKGRNQLSYKCNVDVWSMGVLCFVALTAQMLFDDDDSQLLVSLESENSHLHGPPKTQAAIRERIRCVAIERKIGCSRQMVDILCGMMEIDPAKRLSSSQVITHEWFTNDQVMLDKAYKLTKGYIGLPLIAGPQSDCQMDSPEEEESMQKQGFDKGGDVGCSSSNSSGFHEFCQSSAISSSFQTPSSSNLSEPLKVGGAVYTPQLPFPDVANAETTKRLLPTNNCLVEVEERSPCHQNLRRSKRIQEAMNRRQALQKNSSDQTGEKTCASRRKGRRSAAALVGNDEKPLKRNRI